MAGGAAGLAKATLRVVAGSPSRTELRFLYNPAEPTPEQLADPVSMTLPPHDMGWYASHLAVTGLVSLLLLYGALALFSRLEDNFAEEI